MRYLLLSHPLDENTPLYGSLPVHRILPYSEISKGDVINTFFISIHNHTGTHIDAPNHFMTDGKQISEYSQDELIFKNPIVVNCPKSDGSLIIPNDLQYTSAQFQKGDCLLLHTGFGKYRSEERYQIYNPGIAPETILWIREEYPNIRCIGIDSISISSFQHRSEGIEAHKAAFCRKEGLGEPLLLIEDMDLRKLSNSKLKLIIVVPWQVNGIDSAPCTVLAEIAEREYYHSNTEDTNKRLVEAELKIWNKVEDIAYAVGKHPDEVYADLTIQFCEFIENHYSGEEYPNEESAKEKIKKGEVESK